MYFKILFHVSSSSPQLQRVRFFSKNRKHLIFQQVTGGNTPIFVLKRILGYILKITSLEKLLISRLKKDLRLSFFCKKENFKPEIKSMIENLQGGLYTIENKKAKGAKFCAKIT